MTLEFITTDLCVESVGFSGVEAIPSQRPWPQIVASSAKHIPGIREGTLILKVPDSFDVLLVLEAHENSSLPYEAINYIRKSNVSKTKQNTKTSKNQRSLVSSL